AEFLRRDRHKGYFAIFGSAELGLVIVEIAGQRLRRRLVDRSGLRRVKFHVFDRPLLVLETAERLDHYFRRLQPARDRARDLTPQRHPPLVGDVTLFAKTELADRGLEPRRIERAADAPEIRIAENHAHGLGVRLPEPQ